MLLSNLSKTVPITSCQKLTWNPPHIPYPLIAPPFSHEFNEAPLNALKNHEDYPFPIFPSSKRWKNLHIPPSPTSPSYAGSDVKVETSSKNNGGNDSNARFKWRRNLGGRHDAGYDRREKEEGSPQVTVVRRSGGGVPTQHRLSW